MSAIRPPTFSELEWRIDAALAIAYEYAEIDGAHHKAWIVDQIVRVLLGAPEEYEAFVANYNSTPDLPEWDEGVAP